MNPIQTENLVEYLPRISPNKKYSDETNEVLIEIHHTIVQLQESYDTLVAHYNDSLTLDSTKENRASLNASLEQIKNSCAEMYDAAFQKIEVYT